MPASITHTHTHTLTPPRAPARPRRVEECMGTVFTLDIRDQQDPSEAAADVVAWLHHVDRVFSTYRPDSDINRINRGQLTVGGADPLVGQVLERCADMQAETGGWFSARRHRRIDPTGLVKGWAVDRASDMLRAAGSEHHAVNGGGDVQTAGESSPGVPWRIGISDPADRSRLLAVITGRDIAVATSGNGERGAHITDPFTGRSAQGVAAVTVIGQRLTRVDSLATAGFAMGIHALDWLESQPEVEALVVTTEGRPLPTSGFAAMCDPDPASAGIRLTETSAGAGISADGAREGNGHG
jgi:thiamine biosynthesis lipoprotein